METIKKIRTELEEHWEGLRGRHWKCAAAQRFGRVWFTPMLAEIGELDDASEELEALCREAVEAAASVRQPNEDDE